MSELRLRTAELTGLVPVSPAAPASVVEGGIGVSPLRWVLAAASPLLALPLLLGCGWVGRPPTERTRWELGGGGCGGTGVWGRRLWG